MAVNRSSVKESFKGAVDLVQEQDDGTRDACRNGLAEKAQQAVLRFRRRARPTRLRGRAGAPSDRAIWPISTEIQ